MDLFRSSSAPLATANSKSRKLLPSILFLLFVVFLFTLDAAQENDAASRQRSSYGIITYCDRTSRGGTYCHYRFSVDEIERTGTSSSHSGYDAGNTVQVYYDSRDPTTTSLEDFSEKARKDRNNAYIALAVFVAFSAYAIHSISNGRA